MEPPEAEPFTAVAKANGFPFCIFDMDISDSGDGTPYDYWTTLGGYNKDHADADIPPTKAQIDASFANAMQLWWNLHSIKGSASASIFAADSSASALVTDLNIDLLNPRLRICNNYHESIGSQRFSDQDPHVEAAAEIKMFLGDLNIVKMYNGSISTSNFVGFGLFNWFLLEYGNSSIDVFGAAVGHSFSLDTFFDRAAYSETAIASVIKMNLSSPSIPIPWVFTYKQINGIHVIHSERDFKFGTDVEAKSSIDSFTFYTYP